MTRKHRETLKQITYLTYNIGDVSALKELGSSFVSWWVLVLPSHRWKYNASGEKSTKNNEKKANEHPTKNYLPLPIRRKRNAFASRVGDRNAKSVLCKCTSLWKHFREEKKKQELRNLTESGKRTQQPPQNHTSQSNNPPCDKRQISPTGDDVHVHVPTANHFKKPKYELTTNS